MLEALRHYVPTGTLPLFEAWLTPYPFRIMVTRPRRTKLGDFRAHPYDERPTITVNADLDPHQFALTLTHEIAHLMAYDQYGARIKAHGAEWKACFSELLKQLAAIETLPIEFRRALRQHALNPKSATVHDANLYKVLLALNGEMGVVLDDLPNGHRFVFQKRAFIKLSTARSRCECREVSTGTRYKIAKLAQVTPLPVSME